MLYLQEPDPLAETGESFTPVGAVALIIGIGLIVAGLSAFLTWKERARFRRGDRHVRIERLKKSLTAALTAIAAIRDDIEDGQRQVRELEARAEVHRELASLSEEEARAVKAALAEQLAGAGRRSAYRDVLLFVLGLLAAWLLR